MFRLLRDSMTLKIDIYYKFN